MNPINPFGIPVPIALPLLDKLLLFLRKYRRLATVLTLLTAVIFLTGFFLIKRAAELDPIYFGPEHRSIKALILYEIGAYSSAARLYRTDYVSYLSREGSTPPMLLHSLAQDFPAAIQSAEERLAEHPNDIDALLTLGQAAYDQGLYQQAAGYTKRVLAMYKEHADALLLAALIATRDPSQGDPIPTLNAALRTGTAARNLTSFLNTLEITGYLLRQPTQDRPLALLAHYYRIMRIYDGGMGGQVIRAAERAIRNGDHPADAYLSIGVVYRKTGKTHKAFDAFLQSTVLNPSHALAYFQISTLYEAAGDTTNQYLFLRNAFRSAPTDPLYLQALSQFLSAMPDLHAMRRFTSEGLAADPDSIPAHALLASAMIRTSDSHEAQGILRLMLNLPPKGPIDLEQQAWAAELLGRSDLQEASLRRSIALDPKRPTPHMELARLFKNTQRLNEALQEFEIAAGASAYQSTQAAQEYCQLYAMQGKANPPKVCMGSGGEPNVNNVGLQR